MRFNFCTHVKGPARGHVQHGLSEAVILCALVVLSPLSRSVMAQAQDRTPASDSGAPRRVEPFVRSVASLGGSVVGIGSYHRRDRPSIRYLGSGFVVHDGSMIATNQHVVAALRKDNREPSLRVFFPNSPTRRGYPAAVLREDKLHDVALLTFEGPPGPAVSLAPDAAPRQGQSVGVLGYPIGLKLGLVPAAHRGVVAAVVPAVLPLPTGARMTPQLREAIENPYNLYQLDMVVYPGNSGSPLFDAYTADVIGIINKTLAGKTREHLLEKPTGIGYAVPVRWIHRLIATQSSASNPEPAKHPTPGNDV